MRRRSFLGKVVVGGGLASWYMLPGYIRGQSADTPTRVGMDQPEPREPIIDVHARLPGERSRP
jgi:hypothetical protein